MAQAKSRRGALAWREETAELAMPPYGSPFTATATRLQTVAWDCPPSHCNYCLGVPAGLQSAAWD